MFYLYHHLQIINILIVSVQHFHNYQSTQSAYEGCFQNRAILTCYKGAYLHSEIHLVNLQEK